MTDLMAFAKSIQRAKQRGHREEIENTRAIIKADIGCSGSCSRHQGRNGRAGYLPGDGGRRFREARASLELSVRPS